MCGRFTLMIDAEQLQSQYGLQEIPLDYAPRYNIAPSQALAVVADWQARKMEWMRWGLVPSWAKDPAIGYKMINARSETVQEKPSFRNAFARRRCLILADGFYEWQKAPGKGPSVPHYFYAREKAPFAFAGLWEFWRSPAGDDLRSCTILTTQANSLVAPVHERMPVMLSGEDWPKWMGAGTAVDWMALLRPFPAERMAVHQVSAAVNSPSRDGRDLVSPAGVSSF